MMTTRENSLPIGTMLNHYKITAILGQGGFGITYLAEDTTLKHKVAIKEYFPTEMGIRDQDSITLHSVTNRKDDFQFGLEKFLEEGRTLVQFKHPNIVRVSNFLKLNNTAYLIMDYEQGEDLGDYLKRTNFKGNMPETELKSYMLPILKGLQAVHDKELLHRDIKPGNIYLRKDAEPMLIDFGAARYALGEHSKSMSAIISMGYAPPEQYSSTGKQNQASDLYAWGATAYQLITGKPPIESPDRLNAIFEDGEDLMQPLSQTYHGKYSKELLTTIDKCLQVSNKNRPQSANEAIVMLTGEKVSVDKTEIVKPEERFKNTHSDTGTKYVKDDERFTNKLNKHTKGEKKKPANNKPLFIGVIAILFAVVSYFGYNHFQNNDSENQLVEQKQQQKQQQRQQQAKLDAQLATDPITNAQNLLIKLGHSVEVSGNLDKRTSLEIKKFEKSHNLAETGEVDNLLIKKLQQAYTKKDDDAWAKALKANTVLAFTKYQQNFLDGKHLSEIEKQIENIKQTEIDNQAKKLAIEQQRLAAEANAKKNRMAKIEADKKQAEIDKKKLAQLKASTQTSSFSGKLKTDNEKTNYMIGSDVGKYLNTATLIFDKDSFIDGVRVQLKGKKSKLAENRITKLREMLKNKSNASFTENKDINYIIGSDVGVYIKKSGMQFNLGAFELGIIDGEAGKDSKLSSSEVASLRLELENKQKIAKKKQAAKDKSKAKRDAITNKNEGNAFRARKEREVGVKKTRSGLLYKVLKEGTGRRPSSSSTTVVVHYTSTLIDGTQFDSSVDRGKPATFALNQVIKGWTEGLQLMREGAKYRFYIPPDLAYGSDARPGSPIGPNSTLIFDVELIEVK